MDFGPDTFVVRVQDDCAMQPAFREGEYVYVDPDERAEPGRYVAVELGAEAVAVRLLVEAGGRRLLRALDPDEPDLVLDESNETMVLGVAVFKGATP